MGKQSDSDFSRHLSFFFSAGLPFREHRKLRCQERCSFPVLRSRTNTLTVARKEPLLAYALPSPYARNSLPSLAATGVANTLRRGCARKKL